MAHPSFSSPTAMMSSGIITKICVFAAASGGAAVSGCAFFFAFCMSSNVQRLDCKDARLRTSACQALAEDQLANLPVCPVHLVKQRPAPGLQGRQAPHVCLSGIGRRPLGKLANLPCAPCQAAMIWLREASTKQVSALGLVHLPPLARLAPL